MSDSVNNQFETEQVSREMFGFTEVNEKPDNEPEKTKKTSFTELRQGRKIPRLKKSLVLTIMVGGIFVFLMLVNIFMQKKEDQKKYFDEQKNLVAIGNDFSLGDIERDPRQLENPVEITESNENYFVPPPVYTPANNTSISSGANYPTPVPNFYYSESDLQAIKAKIGKEGGYGLTAMSAGFSPTDSVALSQVGYYDGLPGTGTAGGTWEQIPTRDEYTRQRIDEIARLTQATGGMGANNADRANNGRYSDAGNYNPHNPQRGGELIYLNDNCLFPGTIIHAILVSRIDTDYPGPIHARVTENVYDSMTGRNLLIPQGTILQGNYSSSSIGIAKVQIAWESMVVNYGGVAYQVSLGGMAGVDKRGRAGIAGSLDDHYFEWLKAAGIISLFTMLNSEVAYQTKGQKNPQIRELMDINQGIVNNLGSRIMERALDIQPTVRVANGTAVSVAVNTVVPLRPFPAIRVEEKWIRK